MFGIGAESYTVGSNEFYMGYAASRQTALCLDAGHFHPTEVISDKISSAMLYVPRLLLHVSRPVRWDSDHVVLLDDETQAIASEIIRHNLFDRVHIGLDFFDASINRIAACYWHPQHEKALLRALLEPTDRLRQLELRGDYTARLALLEEQNPCHGKPSGKVTASAMTYRLMPAGLTQYVNMNNRFSANVKDS